jgi:acyl transferase domain-containing protein/NAD(P)-dependent dehydrogenase (short-subunit alcohol dehydrogenase family)/acyl carrier protein
MDNVQPLAIVGIGCRFPGGAVDSESLWRMLCDGVDAIKEIPADRFHLGRFYYADASVAGKTYVRHGGFLDQSPYDFDAGFFGLSNREAAILDPQQRLLLEVTWEAFEDAGQDCLALRGRRVGVFIGGFSLDNLLDRMGSQSRDHISPSTATSSTMTMLSNRLSHAFDFAGPSLSIDTACSSALVATHLACRSLWTGESEVAIAGGVNIMMVPEPFVAMAKGGYLSRTGRCQAFDAAADGYVRAEGAGIIVIKPLASAIEAGDRIYARILATGVNQDGHTPGISAPNPQSQQALIRRVLSDARVTPADISYAEAHGTGTQVGDPIEAESLGSVLGVERAPDRPLLVGSIKSNIGHTEAAAGIAGLIKAALVLHHREVPPNLHFKTPNPRIDLDGLHIRVPTSVQPLAPVGPLFVAVNSFGYGGTNAHAVLGDASTTDEPTKGGLTSLHDEVGDADLASRLYPISARDEGALVAYAASLADAIESTPLRDVGFTLACRRSHHPVRAAVWARSTEDLAQKLRNIQAAQQEGFGHIGRAPEKPRRLLFVFTGMGAQYVGMGRQLFNQQPIFREAIERCDALARPIFGRSLVDFFKNASDPNNSGEPIRAPIAAQLPNLALQVGLTELWRSLGIEPDGVIGHSVGEIGAAWAAGALTLDEAIRLTCHRGEIFQRIAGRGSMMAIGLGRVEVEALLSGRGDGLSVSAVLAPDSTVVSGPAAALDRLATDLATEEIFHRRLHVDVAYHHAQVDAIEDELRTRFGTVAHRSPRLPLYSTLEGCRIEGERHDCGYWIRNGRSRADFEAAISAALGDGFDAVLEIGPNRVMSPAVLSCASAAGKAVWTGASMVRGGEESPQIERLLSEMYVQGVPIRWAAHYSCGRLVRLPSYPWQRTRLWLEAPESRSSRELDPAEALLHQRLNNPIPAWETDLSASTLSYFSDHVVEQAALFPAAGHVAALLAASRALNRGNCLEGLRLLRALPLSATTRLRVEVDNETGAATVCARRDHTEAWQRHASGRLCLFRGPRCAKLDIEELQRSASTHLDAASLYAALAARGLTYGPQFQPIQHIWFSGDELTATLQLPPDVPGAGALHPVLLDGAFQALAAIADADGRGPLVPVSIDEVRLHGAIARSAQAVARIIERTPNSFIASLSLCDADGDVLAEIDGLRCQRLPTAGTDHLSRASFHDVWETSPVPALERTASQRWVLLDGDGAHAAALAVELRGYGHSVIQSASSNMEGLRGAGEVEGIVWFADTVDLGDAGCAAAGRLLKIVQEMNCLPSPRPRLVIVTEGATGATQRPDKAAVWGLGRVAAAECPDLKVTLVDCEDDHRVPLWIARELLGDSPDREIFLGSNGRQVNRLESWSAPQPDPEPVDVEKVAVTLRKSRTGSQDSLTWFETQLPEPGPGELEIQSRATALNFKDVLKSMNLLSSAYLERTFFGDNLGMETAGVVTKVGPDVTDFTVGDEVVYIFPHFASRQVLSTHYVMKRPPQLSATQAPIFINYTTAYHSLIEIARLRAGERVLIHLASGGVGQAAISIARMAGAQIYATAGDDEKRDFLRKSGIEHVFDSRSLDFADQILQLTDGVGVDVVLNSLPGEALRRSWDVLAPYGRFIEIGKRDIEEDSALPMRRFCANRLFAAVDVDRLMRERLDLYRPLFAEAVNLVAKGLIGPIPVTVFPAAQVSEAFRLMSRARHIGKVVVDFQGQSVPAKRLRPKRFRPDRTYLVTGAFGGFGQALVRWMVQQGARNLALAGRSGAGAPGARELMDEVAKAGAVARTCSLDVSDGESVRALLEDIRQSGAPLGGIFHLAAVLDDSLLASYDDARLSAVMAPKAQGALNLHRFSAGDPVDHFVLFSSISQVIGNIGQGAYCAANAYLDALARNRRANGLPGLSIAWGVLSDAGMTARAKGLVAQLQNRGIRAFTTAQALAALDSFMDAAPANVVFADVDWEKWADTSEAAKTPRFSLLVHTTASSDRLTELRRKLSSLPSAERAGLLEESIRTTLGEVLGTPADRIPLDRSLDSLGVDSLMAVELTINLEREVGVRLPSTLLMQGPSITALAAHILKELFAVDRLEEMNIESLSEAEADAMLEMLIASGELNLEAAE